MEESKPKESVLRLYITTLSPLISAFLIILLIYAAFKVGIYYGCAGGMLYMDRCVQPRVVDTINVCELKNDCREVCKVAILNHATALNLTLKVDVNRK